MTGVCVRASKRNSGGSGSRSAAEVFGDSYGPKVGWTRQPAGNGRLSVKALPVVSKFLCKKEREGKEREGEKSLINGIRSYRRGTCKRRLCALKCLKVGGCF